MTQKQSLGDQIQKHYPPKKTNMTIKHPPFEDVFPIENGDFPVSHVSELRGVEERNVGKSTC